MQERHNGGPAFPAQFTNDGDLTIAAPDGQLVPPCTTVQMAGMSLRDWFAGKAMQGYISMAVEGAAAQDTSEARAAVANGLPKTVAEAAYAFADAMLEARKK